MGRSLMISGGEEGVLYDSNAKNFYAKTTTLEGEGNQDGVLLNSEAKLALVADGVGGAEAGEFASTCALSQLNDFLDIDPGFGPEVYSRMVREAVVRTILELTNVAYMERLWRPDFSMGTTFAAVKELEPRESDGQRLVGAWYMGDSKVYVVGRDGSLKYVSRDHSAYERWADEMSSILLQCMGDWKFDSKVLVTDQVAFRRIVDAAGFQDRPREIWLSILKYLGANVCDVACIDDLLRFLHYDKNKISACLSSLNGTAHAKHFAEVKSDKIRGRFVPVEPGDRCAVVSDGISGLVSDGEIVDKLSKDVSFYYVMGSVAHLAAKRAKAVAAKQGFRVEFGSRFNGSNACLAFNFPGGALKAYRDQTYLFSPDHMSIAGFEVGE